MKPTVRTVLSQPSWILQTPQVKLALTCLGGHMAPVTFCRDRAGGIQPYYISPWQGEAIRKFGAPVLAPLRGDFFCLPFGGNGQAVGGEKHPPHGETAGSTWKFIRQERTGPAVKLTVALKLKARPGKVTKDLALVEGHNAVYLQHTLDDFGAAAFPIAHHCTLAVGDEPGAMRVWTSPIRFGLTYPGLFSDPANREYQSLAMGARFDNLRHVPLLWKDPAVGDCTRFPVRRGFCDLLAVVNQPGSPAWTTATCASAGYLWYALKLPAQLPLTVMWIENGGRHGEPWNGRNRCLGLEDACGYFADGLAASIKPNALSRQGVPTAIKLKSGQATVIRHIQGVVRIPRGFDSVARVELDAARATFISAAGRSVRTAVRHEFLEDGQLE